MFVGVPLVWSKALISYWTQLVHGFNYQSLAPVRMRVVSFTPVVSFQEQGLSRVPVLVNYCSVWDSVEGGDERPAREARCPAVSPAGFH